MTDLRSQLAKQKRYDALFVNSTKAFAILVLLSLGGILVSLIVGAWPSIQEFGLGFYTSNNWDTVANEYGALAPIYGTLVTSFIAIVIAVPVSFGIAIFLTEMCPKFLKKPLGIAISCWQVFLLSFMGCGACLSLRLSLVSTFSHGLLSMWARYLSSASYLQAHPWD